MKFSLPIICLVMSSASCPVFAETPTARELSQLQEQRDKAAAAALAPINAKFIALLKPLLAKATQQNDIDTAKKITALLTPDGASKPESQLNSTPEAQDIKNLLSNSLWKCTNGTLMNQWTMQILPNGDIDLTKPDGNTGWGAWFWELDANNRLIFKIPGQRKPNEAKLSKDAMRLTLSFSGTQTFTRIEASQ